VALHGLQQALGRAYGCVVYADDLVVCASTREKIEAARVIIEDWLKPRGLALHQEKTRIVHVDDGFNFLGFSIRRYKGKCLIKPQKEKVLSFLRKQRLWLSKHKTTTAEHVIRHLNPILRGWTQNYRHVVSKEVFSYVSDQILKMLWRWCRRRHQHKSRPWIRKKYFGVDTCWRFQAKSGDKTIYLFDVGITQIERHIKVAGTASPDHPALRDYWNTRRNERYQSLRRRKITKSPANIGVGGAS
jgi:RNA-directed DNA polymerase